MGKSAGSTTNTSSTGPSTFQQPYINKLLSEADRLYNTGGPQFFPGNTVAGFTDTEKAGQQAILGNAAKQTSFWDSNVPEAVRVGLNSYDVASNPVVANAAKAATNPIMTQLKEEVLPGISSGAISSGGLGSSRQGIAQAQGIERASRAAMDTSAGVYNQAYAQGLSALGNTLGLMPSLQQASFVPGAAQSAVGAQERELNQAKINEDMARYSYNQNLPFQNLVEYGNTVSKPFGGTSTSAVQATGNSSNQTIGAILAALGLGTSIWDWLKP